MSTTSLYTPQLEIPTFTPRSTAEGGNRERLTLEVEGVTAGYRSRMVLEELSLEPIRGGRLTAFVGPNGAGKTTLLRTLAGLLRAHGSIRLNGRELVGAPLQEFAEEVTYMPQALPQRVSLSVLEGVIGAIRASEGGGLRGGDPAHQRALAILERVGILDLALEPLDQLSGGQRQLASLAQALVREPRLLLLDEPTSALDLRHQTLVMNLVSELASEGRIVIAVLHDLDLAVRWAEQIVVIDEGRVVAEGSPEEAITESMLAHVYGVEARVERCTLGRLRVAVDGPIREDELGCGIGCHFCALSPRNP